jgi:hypothetical protein
MGGEEKAAGDLRSDSGSLRRRSQQTTRKNKFKTPGRTYKMLYTTVYDVFSNLIAISNTTTKFTNL